MLSEIGVSVYFEENAIDTAMMNSENDRYFSRHVCTAGKHIHIGKYALEL